jgi:DNA polymerase I-like protein with 3'-5' exonuclease and polymerase domains
MALIIPETVKGLSMLDAFRFYRDELKWQVYPVHPPWAKVTDPGKQPAVRKWWAYDAHDCDVATRFKAGHPYNIGLAPKVPLIIADLDDKANCGKGVAEFLLSKPEINQTPRHLSRNGAHLVFLCPDLPSWAKSNGKPHMDALRVKINETVTAELFYSDHSNVIVPPSRHPLDDFVYAWSVFGEIPVVDWKWLQDIFGFSAPVDASQTRQKSSKRKHWYEAFKGDLTSLDLIDLLETLGYPARLLDDEDGKYAILCPWESEHSHKKDVTSDSSTVIWQPLDDQKWPAFKCQHSHCAERGLEQLLEWATSKEPGIVERFCSRQRTWQSGQKSRQGLPRVLHAQGRLESEVYEEIGRIIAPEHDWFRRGDQIVAVRKAPSGFVYSDNPGTRYSIESFQVGLGELSPLEAKSSLEKYMEPGYLKGDPPQFVPCSFPTEFCSGLLRAEQLKNHLFHIVRLLPVPLPFRVGDKLIYPKSGYDPQFGTFLLPGHPLIKTVSLTYAVEVLKRLHRDFCFTNEQSRTHALAALLTPFSRAIIGWTTRTPLSFYSGNRPRTGKDYLAAIRLLVYEGHAFEDLPIGKESEETAKRIMAAARNGRRFMHFSNCQTYLEDAYLTQALTNRVISGRRLGSNDASSDLSLPNEIEFSLSANVGLTYREDFEPRMRKIELAFFEEDPNERKFKDKFLHRTITENRSLILSAIAALFNHWALQGFPLGKTDFISYPEWAHTIGGIMTCAGLGDPCLPFASSYETGGDLKTAAMTALFGLCFENFADAWVSKSRIYQAIHHAMEQEDAEPDSALGWFGPMEGTEEARKNQTRLGIQLRIFKDRILGGIQLLLNDRSANSSRHLYRFTRIEKPPEPQEVLEVPEVPAGPHLDILSGDFLACDLETCAEVKVSRRGTPKIRSTAEALNPFKGEIRLLTLADGEGNIRSFDFREGELPDEIRAALSSCPLIIHNACFDLLFLKVKLAIAPRAPVFCTLTASRLLEPVRGVSHSLKAALERYLKINLPKEHGASDWGAFVLTEEQLAYARNDVRHLHKLVTTLQKEIETASLERVFALEMELIPIVVAMEYHGFTVDRVKLEQIRTSALEQGSRLSRELRTLFGLPTLNPASPVELLEAFKASGIELPDTDESTLSALQDERVAILLAYREAAKLEATAKTLLKAIGTDGRIHARFNPIGSLAGRFSSKGPNLQNVTRGALRTCFIPSTADRALVVADYSQIELRIGAYFAQDKVMLDAFGARKDLHRATAAAVLSKKVADVTRADRQLAKAVNFGFLYGQQANGFRTYARTQYGIVLDFAQATELRDKFFGCYHGLAKWHHAAWQKAQEGVECARTVLGRLLRAQGGRDWDRFQLHTNYTVQGSAADVIKTAMAKVTSLIPSDVRLVATVHDELVFDCPSAEAPQYTGIIRAVMEDAFHELFPGLPIEVEAKQCAHWAEK